MGRWATLTMNLPKSSATGSGKMRIISIYRATAENSGDKSALSQQMRVLANGGRNLKPHRAFAEDLENYKKPLPEKGEHFIITGYFNCTLKDGMLQNLMSEYSLK